MEIMARQRLWSPLRPDSIGDRSRSLTPASVAIFREHRYCVLGREWCQYRFYSHRCTLVSEGAVSSRDQDTPDYLLSSLAGKVVIQVKTKDFLTTLFVGIDVGSRNNVVALLDFESNKPLEKFTVANNTPGTKELVQKLLIFMKGHRNLTRIRIAFESTALYGIHLANYLSTCKELLPFGTLVFCLNPKTIRNYKKSFIDLGKNDKIDAFVIADFARANRITTSPWRGSQYLALQRLTRQRLHFTRELAREKNYMLSNIFLKFSELPLLAKGERPFSDMYGVTSSAVLTNFLSTQEIIETPTEELIHFICKESKHTCPDPKAAAELLKKAAENSYHLDRQFDEPITLAIASSYVLVNTYQQQIRVIENAIKKTIRGLNPNAFEALMSIPGIGPVTAGGLIAEIGDITAFYSEEALAKQAGLVWRENQSGSFKSEETPLSKAGNPFLRYYILEGASHVKDKDEVYSEYFHKKLAEVKTHQHKRALALTGRKLTRLIYRLLANDQLYSPQRGVVQKNR